MGCLLEALFEGLAGCLVDALVGVLLVPLAYVLITPVVLVWALFGPGCYSEKVKQRYAIIADLPVRACLVQRTPAARPRRSRWH